MSGREVDEVERTYDVAAGTVVPTLTGLVDGLVMGQPVELHLEAVYFDTADLALARRGVTLRRRTGGEDAGWHVKLPRSGDARTEQRFPLGRATKTVPKAVLPSVQALVRDRPLVPVARIATRRLERVLHDSDGTVLARLCDDEVEAQRLVEPQQYPSWREWEVELDGGDADLLDTVGARLVEQGASPAGTSTKLLRVLGDLAPARRPADGSEGADANAGQLLVAHVADVTTTLHRYDARLRAGEEDAVHQLRIAARRLRSALRTFAPVLDRERTDPLAEELRWLGQLLNDARDAQVMREHLLHLLDHEPVELVVGPVRSRVDDELRSAERTGRETAVAALGSERYFRLLDDLDALIDDPPLTGDASAPAGDLLPTLLRRDMKRLRRAVDAVGRAEDAAATDAALHEARKKAKRLRYAAEAAGPAMGKEADRVARRAKRVQQALGRHQDTVVARAHLRDAGMRAHLAGENAFTYGRLHALEEQAARAAVADFRAAWSKLRS
jgi:CHAD domain-containing protein